MSKERETHPVVEAVLSDPVVKAALDDASLAPPAAPVPGGPHAPSVIPKDAPVLLPGQPGEVRPHRPDVLSLPGGRVTAVPTTTEEQDRATVGQRRVNLIWESQQALIASAVVGTALYVSGLVTIKILDNTATEQQTAMAVTGFMLLSNIVNLVIGFYFGRTNHQKVGGVEQGR